VRPAPDPARPHWLTVQNVTFRNVTSVVEPGQTAGCFLCTPTEPCAGFNFVGVTARTSAGAPAAPYSRFNFGGASSSGGSVPQPCGVGL